MAHTKAEYEANTAIAQAYVATSEATAVSLENKNSLCQAINCAFWVEIASDARLKADTIAHDVSECTTIANGAPYSTYGDLIKWPLSVLHSVNAVNLYGGMSPQAAAQSDTNYIAALCAQHNSQTGHTRNI